LVMDKYNSLATTACVYTPSKSVKIMRFGSTN
jgi:hypothetical protein